ncbi:MAG TPA: permease [Elusimicrobiota bacterium]|nr:permease [Elusimicrobiota bacterium]
MLKTTIEYLIFGWMGLSRGTRLGESANFFIYDSVKIVLLLTVIVFVIAVIRSYFSPERTRALLVHRRQYVGNVLAALLGIVTPFCSCSAVPLFIGFIESGGPLGVTFSFLVSSPMVNEVAMILLWGLFGAKVALLYVGTGVLVAIVSGIVIGRLKMEKYVQEYVYQMKLGAAGETSPSFRQRLADARLYTWDLLKKITPYVLVGVGIGAFIHGYAPADFLAVHAGRDNPFAVPLAVAIGVPLYSNAAGMIPVVQALMGKGLPIGTALAFMMAVTALSFPEAVILKKVLKLRLLLTFFGIVALAIIGVGYLLNGVLS